MKKTFQQGFTLIELLVVIAIIGILAAVVLASLNDARSGGQNASIKQTMSSLRSQAELYYNSATEGNYSYTDFCGHNRAIGPIAAAVNVVNGSAYTTDDSDAATNDVATESSRKAACGDNASAYQATTPMANGIGFWCVDSTGFSGPLDSAPADGATSCS